MTNFYSALSGALNHLIHRQLRLKPIDENEKY